MTRLSSLMLQFDLENETLTVVQASCGTWSAMQRGMARHCGSETWTTNSIQEFRYCGLRDTDPPEVRETKWSLTGKLLGEKDLGFSFGCHVDKKHLEESYRYLPLTSRAQDLHLWQQDNETSILWKEQWHDWPHLWLRCWQVERPMERLHQTQIYEYWR